MAQTKRSAYSRSQRVADAQAALAAAEAAKPGAYASPWQSRLEAAMETLLSRPEFSYDLNGDALYRQYKDQALGTGKRAMEDTLSKAAALTGGYGNSYAQSAGQQAYSRELSALNDKIPQLYALALEQYDRQGQRLKENYAVLRQQEDGAYSRYQSALEAWQKERQQMWERYVNSSETDYTLWKDAQEAAYRHSRDEVSDSQWQAEFDEAKRRYDQQWQQKQTTRSAKSGGGSAKKKTTKKAASAPAAGSAPSSGTGSSGARTPSVRKDRIALY